MNRTGFLIFIFIFIFLLEWYAFQLIKTATLGLSPSWKMIIQYIYLAFSLVILLSFLFYNFGNPDVLGKHARTFILSFLFINFLTKLIFGLFLLFDDLQRGLRWMVAKLSNPESMEASEGISRSTFLAKTGIVVAAAPIVSLSWGILSGAHDYRIRRIKLPIKGLPQALQGLQIAQISDIHSGSFWNKTAVKGGVEMLQKEKADIIFFTGDLVNNRATEMSNWIDVFSKIKAPFGVYSVFGNHDYGDYVSWESSTAKMQNLKDLALIQHQMGWNLLNNENINLKIGSEKLGIIGVENWSGNGRFPKYGNLNQAMKGLEDTSLNILLSHDPSHWKGEVLSQYPEIDLTLSGHTHGMQFGIEIPGFKWSPVQYMYKEWAGLYRSRDQYLYVNRGFGYIGYPGRIGIPPEITMISLERA